jgi:hypothetical protein
MHVAVVTFLVVDSQPVNGSVGLGGGGTCFGEGGGIDDCFSSELVFATTSHKVSGIKKARFDPRRIQVNLTR